MPANQRMDATQQQRHYGAEKSSFRERALEGSCVTVNNVYYHLEYSKDATTDKENSEKQTPSGLGPNTHLFHDHAVLLTCDSTQILWIRPADLQTVWIGRG
jgi:hypothetical protein